MVTAIDLKVIAGKSYAVAPSVVPPIVRPVSIRYVTAMADRAENGRLVLHAQKSAQIARSYNRTIRCE